MHGGCLPGAVKAATAASKASVGDSTAGGEGKDVAVGILSPMNSAGNSVPKTSSASGGAIAALLVPECQSILSVRQQRLLRHLSGVANTALY